MPIHGDFRMLKIHGELAETVGVAKNNIFVLENGDSLLLAKHMITKGPHYPAEPIYIDGRDISGLNEAVIKDREIMKEDGLVAVAIYIDSTKSLLLNEPTVLTKGFANNQKEMINNIRSVITASLQKVLANHAKFSDIKNAIRHDVGNYIYHKVGRKPLIIPVVMDVK